MKLYKLLLFLLLLGFSIEMPAQISLLDKIKCDTLKIGMVKTERLKHKQRFDPSVLSANYANYQLRVEEPLRLVFRANYSTIGSKRELKLGLDHLECHLEIKRASRVYYQNTQKVSPQGLSSVSFTDTLLLFAGTYNLTSIVKEKTKVSVGNGVDSAGIWGTVVPAVNLTDSSSGLPVLSLPLPPIRTIDWLMSMLPFSYLTNLSIGVGGPAPEEQPMAVIPRPASPVGNSLLPENFDKNAVAVFKSRTGDQEEGILSVNYYDGLGRLNETVVQGVSPLHKDIATLQEYDGWRRKSNTWLPVVSSQATGNFVSADSYRKLAQSTYGGDSYPYQSLVYESSPLEKIIGLHNPGNAWRLREKSSKTDEYVTIAGNDTLSCLSFQWIDGDKEAIRIIVGAPYDDGSLLVTRSEDEDGATLFDFKDRLGRTVLARRIESRAKGKKQLVDTYYIYNDLGELCAVLPPALSDQLSTGSVPAEKLEWYGYLYKYDIAGNLMAKKLPGIGWEYYVYNEDNHLIFSQNGEERKRGEWKFSIPDVFGRICLQGVCKAVIDPFDSPYLKPGSDGYVCKYVGGTEYGGYRFNGSLTVGLTGAEPLVQTINYYDNYDFMYREALFEEGGFAYVHKEGFAATVSNAKGMLTGTRKLHSDAYERYCNDTVDVDSRYYYSVMYYDDRGRLSQSVSDNRRGGMDRDFLSYDFNGNPLQHLRHQTDLEHDTLSDRYAYEYDHAERLVKVSHRIGDSPEVTLINNVYDDLGRLSQKTFHNGLLNTSYAYNIRSWLTGISNPIFEQVLHYTDGVGIPYYNGDISSMSWRSGSDATVRGYCFAYDGLDRLMNAEYGEGDDLAQNRHRFNEQVTGYDKMGNILGMKRSGQTSSAEYDLIDDLAMSYNGNQLKSVSDRAINSVYGNGFDFSDGTSQDIEYTYDENGNLTKDLNKKITDIQYNSLNLPNRVQFDDGSSISYVYDADGIKLRTVHIVGKDTLLTDYCGNVIYENGTPVKLLTEVGYVTLDDSKYHYFIQDHQGNIRVVVDEDGVVEEVNDYYPFGGLMSSSANTVQPYKYNGKELDRKGGLDWYDYGARMYDAAIGRWHSVDPSGEKYYSWSLYAYCKNNPILRIDLDGKDDYKISETGKLSQTIVHGSSYDRLFSSNSNVKPIIVKNKGLLSDMFNMQYDMMNPSRGIHVSTTELEDAATVFKFAADHTRVEWKLDIYDNNGSKSAIIGTDRSENSVFSDMQKKLNISGEKVFDLHSHP